VHVQAPDVAAAHLATQRLLLATAQGVAHASVRDVDQLHLAHQAVAVACAAAHVLTGTTAPGHRRALDDLVADARPDLRPGDLPRLVEVLTYDWRSAAMAAVADRPGGPSGDDLRRSARGARELLTLTLSLLRAEADRVSVTSSLDKRSPAWRTMVSTDHATRAGLAAWASATDVWASHRTSTPGSTDLTQVTSNLVTTVGSIAREGPTWKSPQDLRRHPDHARLLTTTAGISAAVHDVAVHHAAAVQRLVAAGHVYAPARSLPPLGAVLDERVPTVGDDELVGERLHAVTTNGWVRLTLSADTAAVREAYRALPDLNRQVRAGFHTLLDQGAADGRQGEHPPLDNHAVNNDAALHAAAFPTSGLLRPGTSAPTRSRPSPAASRDAGLER